MLENFRANDFKGLDNAISISCENAYFFMRFRLSSILKRPKTLKIKAIENGFKRELFWKRTFFKRLGL